MKTDSRQKIQLISVITALIAFAFVAVCVQTGLTGDVEAFLHSFVIAGMSPGLTAAARAVTFLCNPPTVVVICLLLLFLPPTRRAAIPVTASAAAAAGINTVLKHIFSRRRPDILWLVEETGFSFPSGHSITSAAIGTALVMLAVRLEKRPRRRAALISADILFPLLIGLSRIYLGVHYAGDVLGGWLLGYVVGASVITIWNAWGSKAAQP